MRVVPLTGITLPFVSLRRLVDRLELPAARAAAGGLGRASRQAAPGCAGEPAARPPVRRDRGRLRRCCSASRRTGSCGPRSSLAARQDNLHEVVREQSIDRGRILAANGAGAGEERNAQDAPTGAPSTSAAIPTGRSSRTSSGYSSPTLNRSGLEQSQNDYLTGSNSDLSGVLARELHSITGGVVKGNDVVTSLEPARAVARPTRGSRRRATGRRGRPRALDRPRASRSRPGRPSTRTRRARHARLAAGAARHATGRCSTASRRAATRRARRSR